MDEPVDHTFSKVPSDLGRERERETHSGRKGGEVGGRGLDLLFKLSRSFDLNPP